MINNPTSLLAYYAAFVSTVLAIWTIYKDIRAFKDMGTLRVKVNLCAFWNPRREPDAEFLQRSFPDVEIDKKIKVEYDRDLGQYLVVDVANVGGKTIRIKNCGWISYEYRNNYFRGNGKYPSRKWRARFRKGGYSMPQTMGRPKMIPKILEPGDHAETVGFDTHFLRDGLYTIYFEDSLGRYFFADENDMQTAITGYPPNGGKWDHAAYE